jgi:hypothetical protein
MRTTDHLRSTMSLVAGVLCATCLWACDSVHPPVSPEPTPSSTPSPPTSPPPVSTTLQRYQVSGRVTDGMGNRIPGVTVEVHYYRYGGPSSALSCQVTFCFLNTLTNADGFFEFELEASQDPRIPGAFGYIYTISKGYNGDVQILPMGSTPITKNLRVSLTQRIDAGQSTTVSLAPDSPLCWDTDDDPDWTRRCEIVRVTAGSAGILFVEARATGGGMAPSISVRPEDYWDGPPALTGLPTTSAPWTVSVPVRAGTILVYLGVPSGTGQKFDVLTSLR